MLGRRPILTRENGRPGKQKPPPRKRQGLFKLRVCRGYSSVMPELLMSCL